MAGSKSNRWMPTAGGILNIISGALCIVGSIALFIVAAIFQTMSPDDLDDLFIELDVAHIIVVLFIILGIIILALGIIAIIGGINALRRKRWGLALAGAICLALGGDILGIVALVFIAMSRKEFIGQENQTEPILQKT